MHDSMTTAPFVPCPSWCDKPAGHDLSDLANGDVRWHDKRFGELGLIEWSVDDKGNRLLDLGPDPIMWPLDDDAQVRGAVTALRQLAVDALAVAEWIEENQ